MKQAKQAERIVQPLQKKEETGPRPLTPEQAHFLDRLDQLVEKRAEQMRKDPADKLALRLLARALYSTYMDLVSCGLTDIAHERLEKAQATVPN